MLRTARRSSRRNGQGLVEFALVLPILLLVLFGVIDLGRAVYAYSTITNSARTGSRVAIVDQDISITCTNTPVPARCAAARQAVALGIKASDVTVAFCASGEDCVSDASQVCTTVAIGCDAVVTVPYVFKAVTPVISAMFPSTGLQLSSTTRLAVERTCTSNC
jgi:Flp pilus assembly protein TadG